MNELAKKKSHESFPSTEEFQRYQGQSHLTLNKSDRNAPMRLRPDFRVVHFLKNRLHRERGEEIAELNFSTAIQEMAFFLKRFMVGHVQKQVEFMTNF